jgi:hypothetical protein
MSVGALKKIYLKSVEDRENYETTIKLCLKMDLDINTVNNKQQTTLMGAIIVENFDAAHLLLDLGIDTNLKDSDGKDASEHLLDGLSIWSREVNHLSQERDIESLKSKIKEFHQYEKLLMRLR